MHHLFELVSAYALLSDGALVVVDDAPDGKGKSLYITEYMGKIGAEVLFQEYQIGFIIP